MKRKVTRLTLDPQSAGEFGVERHFGGGIVRTLLVLMSQNGVIGS